MLDWDKPEMAAITVLACAVGEWMEAVAPLTLLPSKFFLVTEAAQ